MCWHNWKQTKYLDKNIKNFHINTNLLISTTIKLNTKNCVYINNQYGMKKNVEQKNDWEKSKVPIFQGNRLCLVAISISVDLIFFFKLLCRLILNYICVFSLWPHGKYLANRPIHSAFKNWYVNKRDWLLSFVESKSFFLINEIPKWHWAVLIGVYESANMELKAYCCTSHNNYCIRKFVRL